MIRQESQEIAAVKTVLMVMLLIVRGLRPALSVNRLVNSYNQLTLGSFRGSKRAINISNYKF